MITASANASLQRRGTATFQGNPNSGTTILVAGASNTNGLIVRTACLVCIGAGVIIALRSGGQDVFLAAPGTVFNFSDSGFFVPPGQALEIGAGATGNYAAVTWDPL